MVDRETLLEVDIKEVFTFYEDFIKLNRPKSEWVKQLLPFLGDTEINNFEKKEIENYTKHQLDILEENGFLDNNQKPVDIEYRFNKFNLRGPQIDTTKPTDIFLGCSDTFGTSQFEDKIWPHLVSSRLNTQYLNCGVPGGSMDTCYLMLKIISKHVKINRVFLLSPSPYRAQLYYRAPDAVRTMQIGPNFHNVYTESKEMREFAKHVFEKVYSCEEMNMIEFEKNLDAIKRIVADSNGALYHTFNPHLPINEGRIHLNLDDRDRARDLRHYGAGFQKQIAEYFISKI